MSSVRVLACGFSHSSGIGKGSGKPYSMAFLHILKEMRGFKNERGEGFTFGYDSGDNARLPVIKTDALIKKIETIRFPALVELMTEAHPDDPLRTIVSDVNVIRSLMEADKSK